MMNDLTPIVRLIFGGELPQSTTFPGYCSMTYDHLNRNRRGRHLLILDVDQELQTPAESWPK